jgi:hypothetical protein
VLESGVFLVGDALQRPLYRRARVETRGNDADGWQRIASRLGDFRYLPAGCGSAAG